MAKSPASITHSAAWAPPVAYNSMSEEILLLDDDRTALSFLESVLTCAGFKCSIAADPAQALARVSTRREIALILSDIYMPGLTGLEFLHQLQTLKLNWRAPAVLFLTARPSLESAVDALRLGACDFLTKPIRPADLVSAIRRTLERVHRERALTPKEAPEATKGHTSVLEAIERLRGLRCQYEHHKLDDVAWELLLEMLRAEQSRSRLSVSALTISIPNVSATTSLRRVSELTARGYLERVPDAHDGRRDFVRLTNISRELLADYLAQADRCLIELR
jgi:DNA-binding response OmpR family regulator